MLMTSELSSSEFGSSVILYSLTEKLDKKNNQTRGVVLCYTLYEICTIFYAQALLICVHFYTSMKEYTSNKKSSLL